MKEWKSIIVYFVVSCCVVLIVRWCDLWVTNWIISSSSNNSFWHVASDGFEQYRDFVVIITGLLTLIIGVAGFGSYFSFKRFREKEAVIIAELNEEKSKFVDSRKQLEMFLKIEEARVVKESDDMGSMSAINAYNEAERLHDNFSHLYVLRGEEYYLMGSKHVHDARVSFEKAIELEPPGSARAWYGLGQATYKAALVDDQKKRQTRMV